MKNLILLALTWATCVHARSTSLTSRGFVDLSTGRSLYTEYRPAKNGKPTLFLVNGLTYSTSNWQKFVEALDLLDPDIGLLRYDMEGMGRTLLKEAPVTWEITLQSQVLDLRALKAKLAITGPTVALGLSYGGAVVLDYASQFPDDFDHFVAMAPFLERLPEQDVLIKNSITAHRLMLPFDPRTDEELYNYYLRILIYTTYPSAEPSVLDNPYKLEAIYRMVKDAKNWNAVTKIRDYPPGKIHVVAARDDEYVKFDRMQIFLQAARGIFASVAVFTDTKHKIPENRPTLAAQWIMQILNDNKDLAKGLTFEVNPTTAEAKSGDLTIPLRQASHCESLL